jgi:hypothetical protein
VEHIGPQRRKLDAVGAGEVVQQARAACSSRLSPSAWTPSTISSISARADSLSRCSASTSTITTVCGGRPHGGLPRLVAACNESERELYARAKSELARKSWRYVQNYADAKSAVVEEIMVRAQEAREWAPEPRAPHPSPAPARARRSCPG